MHDTVLGTAALEALTPEQRHAYLIEAVTLSGLKKPKAKKRADPKRANRPDGLASVLAAVLDPKRWGREYLGSKDRLLAIAIGRAIGRRVEARLSWEAMRQETGLSRSDVFRSLAKLCVDAKEPNPKKAKKPAPFALFKKERRGLGETNVYRLLDQSHGRDLRIPRAGFESPTS